MFDLPAAAATPHITPRITQPATPPIAPPIAPPITPPAVARSLPAPPADAAAWVRSLGSRDLESLLRTTSAELAAGTHRFLVLVAEFDRRGAHIDWECRSTADWLSWHCGVGPSAAREQVRVARRLDELPEISAAFAEGRISYSKVRALTRVADPGCESELLGLADAATAGQLERICAALRRHGGPADDEAAAESAEDAAVLRASVDWYRTATGEVVGTFRLPPEAAERFSTAVDTLTGRLPADMAPEERRAAAFEHLVTAVPDDPADPAGGRPRPEVVVHLDLAALGRLAADAGSGPNPDPLDDRGVVARTASGRQVSARTVARLVSDATLRFVAERPDGPPLDLGRASRTVPPRLFRTLADRDRHCRFPGCSSTARLHAHHIEWWSRGGRTDRDNLLLLCAKHHHAVHDRGWRCEGSASAPRFARPDGSEVPVAAPRTSASAEALSRANRRDGRRVADGAGGQWCGDQIDWVCLFAAFAHHLPLKILTTPPPVAPRSAATAHEGRRAPAARAPRARC